MGVLESDEIAFFFLNETWDPNQLIVTNFRSYLVSNLEDNICCSRGKVQISQKVANLVD